MSFREYDDINIRILAILCVIVQRRIWANLNDLMVILVLCMSLRMRLSCIGVMSDNRHHCMYITAGSLTTFLIFRSNLLLELAFNLSMVRWLSE